jgi:glycosyltransferase involved in cell wall biosynthesis
MMHSERLRRWTRLADDRIQSKNSRHLRILFVTDFFPPETNAAASRVFERARYWVRWGHEVQILTSAPNFPSGKVYPGYRNRWRQVEDLDGIKVIRIKTYVAPNRGRWRRSFDFISFLFTALPVGLTLPRAEVVAATSPNFFAGLAACLLAMIHRRPFVLEIGDLWPAFVKSLGALRVSPILRALEAIELFMYRHAVKVVCLSAGFKKNLVSRGIDSDKISVILNGVETDKFHPGPPDGHDIERLHLTSRRLTVGYYGTQGAAHGLETVLDAASLLPDIEFLFVGEGAEADHLRSKTTTLGLKNVKLVPAQPRCAMPGLWRLCDVALVQLKDLPLLDSAIPSKIFEAMATARPILLAAPEGEAAKIVAQAGCGLHIPPQNVDALVDAIARLADNAELRKRLGRQGWHASRLHTRERQARKFLDVLQSTGPLDDPGS